MFHSLVMDVNFFRYTSTSSLYYTRRNYNSAVWKRKNFSLHKLKFTNLSATYDKFKPREHFRIIVSRNKGNIF